MIDWHPIGRGFILLIQWAIVGVYVVTMFLFASQEGSSDIYTGTFLARLLPHLSSAELRQVVLVARKVGHVVAYGFLTLIVNYAARKTNRLRTRALPFAVVFAVIVAMADEAYQYRLTHRTGTFADVLIDGLGIVLTTFGVWISTRVRKKDKEVVNDAEDKRR